MDNRMNSDNNEQPSTQPSSGMPGFKAVQPDRSGTETLRSHNDDEFQPTDASSTPHSGGAEFRRGSQESSGSQSSASRSEGSQSGALQSGDDTFSESQSDASGWMAVRDKFMETVRRNPIPLALGLAGVAALLVSLRASRTRR